MVLILVLIYVNGDNVTNTNIETNVSQNESENIFPSKVTTGQGVLVEDFRGNAEKLNDRTFTLHNGSSLKDLSFTITYFQEYDFFQVNLETEPISEMRIAAEEELIRQLDIDRDDLCKLNASVKTTVWVNQYYAGNELGFSNCSGSIEL
ncbi:hypothetical protein KC723_02645 [Candidatus Kaiserbacteria bacterium]|nr:hypothetical protein [Candidatus Kaiserbacteria bacterium]